MNTPKEFFTTGAAGAREEQTALVPSHPGCAARKRVVMPLMEALTATAWVFCPFPFAEAQFRQIEGLIFDRYQLMATYRREFAGGNPFYSIHAVELRGGEPGAHRAIARMIKAVHVEATGGNDEYRGICTVELGARPAWAQSMIVRKLVYEAHPLEHGWVIATFLQEYVNPQFAYVPRRFSRARLKASGLQGYIQNSLRYREELCECYQLPHADGWRIFPSLPDAEARAETLRREEHPLPSVGFFACPSCRGKRLFFRMDPAEEYQCWHCAMDHFIAGQTAVQARWGSTSPDD